VNVPVSILVYSTTPVTMNMRNPELYFIILLLTLLSHFMTVQHKFRGFSRKPDLALFGYPD